MIVATSEGFTDFAYISWVKEQLALETPAHNRQYPDQKRNALDSDVESRDHDISRGSTIPESVVPNYSDSSG